MSVEQWKYKFLYPFGNIAPIGDKLGQEAHSFKDEYSFDKELNGNEFNSLVKKYLYPIEKIHKPEWLKEL